MIIDDNRNNKDYLLHRFKLFMKKHQKFELLDDYDLAGCFLAKKQFEYLKINEHLKTEESKKYPRLDNFPLNKVTVLINKNITNGINLKIYNLATGKRSLGKFIDFIERRGNTPDEIKFYDAYHLYKDAISGYSAGMKKDNVMILSHIRVVSDELYATDKSRTIRIEQLKVELYHLKKLLSKRIDIEFRPLFVTSTLKNGFYYPPFEERSAAGILENVVYDIQDIPDIQRVIYGPAYQARKSLLAYALYICGISSTESFAHSVFNKKDGNGKRIMSDQDIYEYLLDKVISFLSIPESNLLQEIAQHYFYSVSVNLGHTPNPNIFLNINDAKEKRLGDFTLRDKVESLKYYLSQDIETAKRKIRPRLDQLISILPIIITFINIINEAEKININRRNPIISNVDLNNAKNDNEIKKTQDVNTLTYQSKAKSEYQKRKEIAINKIESLDKIEKINVVQETYGPLKVWTQKNNRASTLVLSAHGWYTKYDNDLSVNSIPKGKEILFLGPNEEKLLEAQEKFGNSPTESLFIPGRYPQIYSRISSEGIEMLDSMREDPHIEKVKNYSIKHYEKTPDEEYYTAIKYNRIKTSNNFIVDFSAIDDLAGEKKLRDIVKLTKPGQPLENYKSIIFYACREIKTPGKLQPTLGGGYNIKFTDIPLSLQSRRTRDTLANITSSGSVNFNGLIVIDEYSIKIGEWIKGKEPMLSYTVDTVGVVPNKRLEGQAHRNML